MGFNHIKTKGQDFESFKAELEDAIEEMEEQFGERDGGNMGGNRGGGRSGNRGGYGERDDYMRYDGVDYGERRGRRNR